MSWAGWGDFFHMGGYGLYVWGSYAVTLGALAMEIIMVSARTRRAMREKRA